MQRQAFSLIELLVVMTLLVMIAVIATVTFARPIERARFSRDLQMITEIDGALRSRARQFGRRVRLQIVPRDGELIAEEYLGKKEFKEFARFQLSENRDDQEGQQDRTREDFNCCQRQVRLRRSIFSQNR